MLQRRTLVPHAQPAWTLVAGWLAASVASLFLSTTIYTYYYAALAPAVILVALPLFAPARRAGPWLLAGTLVWLMAVFNPPAKAAAARAEQATLADMAATIGHGACLYVYDGRLRSIG